jgi:hypothetical protein
MDFYKMSMSLIKFYTQLKLEQYESKLCQKTRPTSECFEEKLPAKNHVKLKIRLLH